MSLPDKGKVVDRTRGASMSDSGYSVGNDVWIFSITTTPTDGVAGTGFGVSGPGSICCSTTGQSYTNTGTKVSPTWTANT